jgi:hypothetical protein
MDPVALLSSMASTLGASGTSPARMRTSCAHVRGTLIAVVGVLGQCLEHHCVHFGRYAVVASRWWCWVLAYVLVGRGQPSE